MVRFGAPPAEREAEAKAGAIRVLLLERPKQIFWIRDWQSAAFVFDLDEHALHTRIDPHDDGGVRARELERVLHQIADDRREDLSIACDDDVLIHGLNNQSDADRVCLQCGRGDHVVDKIGHVGRFLTLNSMRQTNLGERLANERPQPQKTTMEHRSRAAGDSHVPGPEYLE